jgi:hypothetical protein
VYAVGLKQFARHTRMRRSLIVVVLAYMLLGRGEGTISYGVDLDGVRQF